MDDNEFFCSFSCSVRGPLVHVVVALVPCPSSASASSRRVGALVDPNRAEQSLLSYSTLMDYVTSTT